jgi:hypothetical protein
MLTACRRSQVVSAQQQQQCGDRRFPGVLQGQVLLAGAGAAGIGRATGVWRPAGSERSHG